MSFLVMDVVHEVLYVLDEPRGHFAIPKLTRLLERAIGDTRINVQILLYCVPDDLPLLQLIINRLWGFQSQVCWAEDASYDVLAALVGPEGPLFALLLESTRLHSCLMRLGALELSPSLLKHFNIDIESLLPEALGERRVTLPVFEYFWIIFGYYVFPAPVLSGSGNVDSVLVLCIDIPRWMLTSCFGWNISSFSFPEMRNGIKSVQRFICLKPCFRLRLDIGFQ